MSEQDLLGQLQGQIDVLRSPEGYLNAGLPNYNHLFGRDSCVSALQLLNHDPTIARGALLALARYQGKRRSLHREEWPGKLLHEHFPGGWRQMLSDIRADSDKFRKLLILITWRFPYYGSVDVGAWFMILLHKYYAATGDDELVRQLWPVVQGVLAWLENHADHTKIGLVGFRKHYIFSLKNQSWKDTLDIEIKPPVAMVEVQGYYFYAYKLMSQLSQEVMKDAEAAEVFNQKADKLQRAFKQHFKVMSDGSLPLAVDRRGQPVKVTTSNPGQLLFTGILDAQDQARVVHRLFEPDLVTKYGIRTESTSSPTFYANSYHRGSIWPFDNWVIYEGLLKTGYKLEAGQIKQSILLAQSDLGRIPELYGFDPASQKLFEIPGACTVQAWSAGALYNMLCQNEASL